MKILVLACDVPATTSMPGSPRLVNLCKGLSSSHDLLLATRSQSEERLRLLRSDPETMQVFEEVVLLSNPPAPKWLGQQIHRLKQAPHFVTRHRNAMYHAFECRSIRELCVAHEVDLIYVDGLGMAQYVEDANLGRPAIIDLHDCLSLLYSRNANLETQWTRRLALRAEARSIERCEASLSESFKLIVVNSEVDENYLRKLNPSANTLTIGNGVDCEFFVSRAYEESDPAALIFTGVMNYGPNEDAAIYFCDAILPLVQQRIPFAEFWVVGKDPTDRVRVLGDRPGVHVTGGVPDMRPYLERSAVFVCPIRYGAGIKNKILAALAMERPVVASSMSIEGLELYDEEHLMVADEPNEFARRIVQLIEDRACASRLGRRGRTRVSKEYSWESSARRLNEEIEHVLLCGNTLLRKQVGGRI